MPSVVEEAAALADAALVIAPSLADVPVLGRLIVLVAHGHGNETKALEQLQEQAKKKETDRKTRIRKNARYVIKASEAMQCVENNLMDNAILLAVGRGLINAITGSKAGFAPDILADKIFTCIEEHVLRQDTPRAKHKPATKYGRPARGHGHGRKIEKARAFTPWEKPEKI